MFFNPIIEGDGLNGLGPKNKDAPPVCKAPCRPKSLKSWKQLISQPFFHHPGRTGSKITFFSIQSLRAMDWAAWKHTQSIRNFTLVAKPRAFPKHKNNKNYYSSNHFSIILDPQALKTETGMHVVASYWPAWDKPLGVSFYISFFPHNYNFAFEMLVLLYKTNSCFTLQ